MAKTRKVKPIKNPVRTKKKKYKKEILWWVIGFVLAILLIGGYSYYNHVKRRYRHYKDFGIVLPYVKYSHGIDVSKYQGNIDWEAVEDMNSHGVQIDFAFVKATEGTMLLDRRFKHNFESLEKTRIKQGAYHFFRCRRSGLAQADFFLKHYLYKPYHLPPVLDIEEADGVEPHIVRERAKEWLVRVQAVTGKKPIIYSNYSFYIDYLSVDPYFNNFPLWIANYYTLSPKSPRDWQFWQHSDKGHVNGIVGDVDFNVFNGDFKKLNHFMKEK